MSEPVRMAKKPDETKPAEGPSFIGEKLFKSRQIQLTGQVDEKVARAITSALLALEADDPEAPITLIVNSPGGSVTSGFAIYDIMRFIQPRIRVVCAGLAASIATVILLGADKEDRLSLPNTRLLIHQPMIPMTVYGPASDLEITANELLKTRERINKLLAAETGQPDAQIERDTQRDYWLTAEEAVEYGLISRVITSRSDLG
ncbi:MAG: ATP-dependent Clp protease proteolytic subunit [Myxococcales bacterium]|nr:ATP-dependent Clp protease proteolytic subunit [Myxococcales bacterium]